jgi:membrane-bound serine protease (ClpP class)
MRSWLPIAVAGLAACGALRAGPERVSLVQIRGAIGPATADYVARAIQQASAVQAQCLIVQLDTPGGLLDSTKEIVGSFYASKVPVVVYVAPSGANAGSAGCFITLAADVAVMAPHSSIGAAHPVEAGGFGGSKPDEVMTKKLENFATSYIEAIADKRHRNVAWARSAVRESASITAEKALELKVVDFLAGDISDLLRQLDGRQINGRSLRTAGAQVEPIPMIAREQFFQTLWRPEVMFILMLIAIYGIMGELYNPGAILPGVAGAIALVVALYMASILPVSLAGVALLLLAVALFVADVYAPTHGVLTVGGIIAFFLGALMMFEPAGPAFRLSLAAIVPGTLITAGFFLFVVGAGLRAQKLPHRAGREAMLGKMATALTAVDAAGGKASIEGEIWNACSSVPVAPGERVEVTAVRGLTLEVNPKPRRLP